MCGKHSRCPETKPVHWFETRPQRYCLALRCYKGEGSREETKKKPHKENPEREKNFPVDIYDFLRICAATVWFEMEGLIPQFDKYDTFYK